MSDSVWILGTSMTRFTRHEGRDLVDLASEAALDALDDGGVTVHDLDVLACGTLFSANAGVGQQLLGDQQRVVHVGSEHGLVPADVGQLVGLELASVRAEPDQIERVARVLHPDQVVERHRDILGGLE